VRLSLPLRQKQTDRADRGYQHKDSRHDQEGAETRDGVDFRRVQLCHHQPGRVWNGLDHPHDRNTAVIQTLNNAPFAQQTLDRKDIRLPQGGS